MDGIKAVLLAGWLAAPAVAWAQAPALSCDDDRAALRVLVGVTAAGRERAEIELAQAVARLRAALAEVERLRQALPAGQK